MWVTMLVIHRLFYPHGYAVVFHRVGWQLSTGLQRYIYRPACMISGVFLLLTVGTGLRFMATRVLVSVDKLAPNS